MRLLFILSLLFAIQFSIFAQDVTIKVNAGATLYEVSPYIYGKNNCFSDQSATAASASEVTRYKDAGLRFVRENSGNNATKHNWRTNLESHPDWYNNVYRHNWDSEAKFIENNIPNVQIMYAFQLIGKAASNTTHNFNDWGYNGSQWWEGVAQNLAGGGVVNPAGGTKALSEGNPDLYLMNWTADSTTEILNHWFGSKGLGFNKDNFQYWSMDNEPEIWSGTHDDVMPTQPAADAFMDLYFDVALKAKQKYPGIKLCGPVVANEWQWFKYGDQNLKINGQYYCWLEYFIKKAADKEKETGTRVLDVVDIHFYPYETKSSDVLQLHRVYFDENYTYPGSNGVKTINSGWDTSQQKEYIFKRINDWLDKYFGQNHGIGLGLTEFGGQSNDPNINALLYASMLGTFANNSVEVFTPWTWKIGMWEIMHLFSRYAKTTSVETTSTLDATVSGYSTINSIGDSLTLMLINRDLTASKSIVVELSQFIVENGKYETLQIASLPTTENFNSNTSNALKANKVTVSANTFSISLPPLSTTAVILNGINTYAEQLSKNNQFKLYPNPVKGELNIELNNCPVKGSTVSVYNFSGKQIETYQLEHGETSFKIKTEKNKAGIYFIEVKTNSFTQSQKFVVIK